MEGSAPESPACVDERPWFVYLLLCRGDRIYAGVTPDLARRLGQHRAGTGARFTRSHPPDRLLAAKRFASRGAALSMEHQVKQLTAARKRVLASVWAEECRHDDLSGSLTALAPEP
jgi:putative endonuclease